jgi:carbon monoxide dehydrogenase subunit G
MNSRALLFPLVLVIGLTTLACSCGMPFAWFNVVRGSGHVVQEERHPGDFDGVDFKSFNNLYIETGEETSLVVEAEDNLMPFLVTELEGDTLEIYVRPGIKLRNTRPVNYYLTVEKDQLQAIKISGSGNVKAPELEAEDFSLIVSGSGDARMAGLEADSLEAKISGSGNLDLGDLQLGPVELKISGSGDIRIDSVEADDLELDISGDGRARIENGQLNSQKITISGSGDYIADQVESDEVEVRINGSGNTRLNVQEHLQVRIGGSGDVSYVGRPRIDQSISGSGRIKSIGE